MSFSAGKNLQNNVNVTEAQTLQNKTIDSTNTVNDAPINNSTITGASLVSPTRADVKKDTQANLETYAATATEGQLVYATDTKTMYQIKNNALSEVSGGAGGINYIENSDFEINLDGYTDDTNLTLARTTLANEILRGSASGKISKAAVDASGEEISIPFTVDRAGLASKITVSLEVDASDANYADGDLRLAVRQDPNGTPSIIRLNGEDIKGGKGKVYAQFQSDATITEYELLIQCNSANASAYDVIIDDVKVGPREVAYGTLVTDYEPFTPIWGANTGSPTIGNGTISGFRRRVGDSMEYMIELNLGSTSSIAGTSNWYFQDPDYTFDENKQANQNQAVGTAFALDTGTAFYAGTVHWGLPSTNAVYIVSDADGGYWGAANPFAWNSANGDYLTIQFSVPIQGWSSNAISSEDLGGREVVVTARGNTGSTITASTENIDFTLVEESISGLWTQTGPNGADTFTTPESGFYMYTGKLRATASIPSWDVHVYKNGSLEIAHGRQSSDLEVDFTGILKLEKGDILNFRTPDTFTQQNNADLHHIHIQKLASPQTILETETVAARYTSDSGQSIQSTQTDIVYEDLDYDTHNAYNPATGEYTVPVSGLYHVKAQWSITANDQEQLTTNITVDGSVTTYVRQQGSRNSALYVIQISDTLLLTKGQVIEITGATSGGTTPLNTSGIYNNLSIARIK